MKTKFSIWKNIERIADSLERISVANDRIGSNVFYGLTDLSATSRHMEDMTERKFKTVIKGISAICKNAYYENLRADEIISLLEGTDINIDDLGKKE